MKNICFLLLILVETASVAQNSLQVKSGLTFSTFLFRNSEKSKDETLKYNTNPCMALSYDMKLGKLHVLRPELGYREAGAHTIFNLQKVSWQLKYLDLNVAYLFRILDHEKWKIYQGVAASAGYLFAAEQILGTQFYDLKAGENLKKIDFGAQFMAGFKVKLVEEVMLNFEYRYGLGIYQIENNNNQSKQSSYNRFHSALVGVCFPL